MDVTERLDGVQMFMEIEQISIILDTNIQGKNDVQFTRNMLLDTEKDDAQSIDDSKLEMLPFFTSNRKLPKETLSSMSYSEITRFFFDRKTFQKYMKSVPYVPLESSNNGDDIVKYNVMTMIELLLPTYPYIKNIYSSIDELPVGGIENPVTESNMFTGWFSAPKKDQPKHRLIIKDVIHSKIANPTKNPISLLIDREQYIMNEIIWLNDVLNHPKYREIFDTLENFNYWKQTTRQNIYEKIVDLKSKQPGIRIMIRDQITMIDEYIKTISSARLNDRKYGFTAKIKNIRDILIKIENEPNSYGLRPRKVREFSAPLPNISDDIVSSLITDTFQLIKLLQSKVGIQISDPSKSKTFSNNRRDIETLYIYLTIQYKYFGDSVDFSFREDEPEVKSFFETHYQKYIEFGKQLRLFIEPYSESTNRNFQEKINTYVNGTSPEFEKYIQSVDKLYISNEEDSTYPLNSIQKFMYVGVSKFTSGSRSDDKNTRIKPVKYEIHLMVNLNANTVKKEEDDTTKSVKTGNIVSRALNCEKQNDDLVDLYNKLKQMPSTLDRKSIIIPTKQTRNVTGGRRQKKRCLTKRRSYTRICRTRRLHA